MPQPTDPTTDSKIEPDLFPHDLSLQSRYPGLQLPPPCFIESGAKIIDHQPNKSLTVTFPVNERQTNPLGTLQGGILAGLFDNAFGPLSYATMKKPCVTIDMTVNFIRGAKPGDTITICAEFKSKNKKIVQMYAEARNSKKKLLATASSNLMVHGS
ncbi:MAG: PaaI family thioesterase [Proteobacteria bacterium]|nr:PaaI family thioesterase [Pseudomonadota bacterium]MBU1686334.1 PaaI family thioesterase [Pseudomonadota bacterium]